MDVGPGAVVANTDSDWFNFFADPRVQRTIDEVNFWRPSGTTSTFRALPPGGPFFLRLKAPTRAIAGVGFFAASLPLTLRTAWEFFGDKNGAATFTEFCGMIESYRRKAGLNVEDIANQRVMCLVLRDLEFLPPGEWLPWDTREEWHDNVVAFKTYSLTSGVGEVLREFLTSLNRSAPLDLAGNFEPIIDDTRQLAEARIVVREAQGAFRSKLLAAYSGACAVTGEHSTPVLDAAHIQPYRGVVSNHVQNGLVMRTDLHRLYDGGYLTVTPNLRIEVSHRLKDEFDNGRTYYALAGQRIQVPPDPQLRPSTKALEWHADHVFR